MLSYLLSIYYVGKVQALVFFVKFSLVECYVYEIFDGYVMDNSYLIFISDVGICKFLRSSMFLVCMVPLTLVLIIIQFLSRKLGETLWTSFFNPQNSERILRFFPWDSSPSLPDWPMQGYLGPSILSMTRQKANFYRPTPLFQHVNLSLQCVNSGFTLKLTFQLTWSLIWRLYKRIFWCVTFSRIQQIIPAFALGYSQEDCIKKATFRLGGTS